MSASDLIPPPDPVGDRGFVRSTFKDLYGSECSIQDSSLATQAAIWLGQHRCADCNAPSRMHLSVALAAELIPVLQRFVDTGSIAKVEDDRALTTDDRLMAMQERIDVLEERATAAEMRADRADSSVLYLASRVTSLEVRRG